MLNSETIVAPATSVGGGGVAIIRISGSESLSSLQRFFRPPRTISSFETHKFYYGHFIDSDQQVVDEVMVVYMQQPRSYTREDVIEIHCHGGRVVVRQIIDCLLTGGIRVANPGEFTLRAFLNGRIDLSEAEAVIDLLESRSEAASHVALRQLGGALSRKIFDYRDRLLEMVALVEAYIDFPEDDMEAPHVHSLRNNCNIVLDEINELLVGFEEGRLLREGLSVLILGKPNVGKSSLLNLLLGQDRAIVTDIPGTTRDLIEESIILSGVPLTIIDTAGIRDTSDPIESDGVKRAKGKISSADIVLYVVDGAGEFVGEVHDDLSMLSDRPVVVVVNKSDQSNFSVPDPLSGFNCVAMSAKFNRGLESLTKAIFASLNISGQETGESTLVSDRRHRDALVRAESYMKQFLEGLDNDLSDEFLSIHLRDALSALGEITGETTPDEILNSIFSRFCIGK